MNTVFHLANEVRGTSRPQSPGHGVAFEEKMWLPLKNETNRPQKSYVTNVDEPEQQLKRINAICLFCCLTFFWLIDVRCLVFMSVHLYRYQAIGWTADTTFWSRRSDFLFCLEPGSVTIHFLNRTTLLLFKSKHRTFFLGEMKRLWTDLTLEMTAYPSPKFCVQPANPDH